MKRFSTSTARTKYTYLNIPRIELQPISRLRPEQVGKFLNGVKNSLMRFCLCKLNVRKFRLFITLVDPNLDSEVDECFELAPASGAVDLIVPAQEAVPNCRAKGYTFVFLLLGQNFGTISNETLYYWMQQD
ncbi:hypothetical protein TIFTF001_010701 [Ficus carica]|uniref:Uncharacterized protein n=1 Tax=Ficus carica TaxID=3494 RepID=A0AA88D043_FICCA|nr:hypothetical protein TIFTF001_010701 [Ficus carica]